MGHYHVSTCPTSGGRVCIDGMTPANNDAGPYIDDRETAVRTMIETRDTLRRAGWGVAGSPDLGYVAIGKFNTLAFQVEECHDDNCRAGPNPTSPLSDGRRG